VFEGGNVENQRKKRRVEKGRLRRGHSALTLLISVDTRKWKQITKQEAKRNQREINTQKKKNYINKSYLFGI
jgi:hypothetical protein